MNGSGLADVEGGKADARRHDAVHRAFAEAGRQAPEKTAAEDVLDDVVGEGKPAGHREYG